LLIHRKNEIPDVKTVKFMLVVKPVVPASSGLSTVLRTLPDIGRWPLSEFRNLLLNAGFYHLAVMLKQCPQTTKQILHTENREVRSAADTSPYKTLHISTMADRE